MLRKRTDEVSRLSMSLIWY